MVRARNKEKIAALVPAVLILLVVVAVFTTAFGSLGSAGEEQAAARLEEALVKGAVTCYANEGIYPPTLDYLVEKYNVRIDEERFYVHYDVFASNIMPDITVIEK